MNARPHVVTPTGALRAWWALIICFVAAGVAVIFSVGYTVKANHDADRRWCDLLVTLDAPQPTVPPRTPQEARSRQIGAKLHRLRMDLEC